MKTTQADNRYFFRSLQQHDHTEIGIFDDDDDAKAAAAKLYKYGRLCVKIGEVALPVAELSESGWGTCKARKAYEDRGAAC